jgi:hypothetical protein
VVTRKCLLKGAVLQVTVDTHGEIMLSVEVWEVKVIPCVVEVGKDICFLHSSLRTYSGSMRLS